MKKEDVNLFMGAMGLLVGLMALWGTGVGILIALHAGFAAALATMTGVGGLVVGLILPRLIHWVRRLPR